MDEKEVIVLCYWNGNIKYGPDGVYYQGSTPKKISVKQKTEFSRLVDGLYLITGFDKQRSKFDIVGRYPVVFSPNLCRYVHLPVVDDSSLKTMLEVPIIHPFINSVELYLEVKPTSDNPGSSLKRQRTQQPQEANGYVDTDMTHPVVKLERDNGIEVNADHESSGAPTLFPTVIPPPRPPTHVSGKRKEKPTEEPLKSASIKKPVIEKDRTKEPPPSDKEEDMVEVEDKEEVEDENEEEEDSGGEEEKETEPVQPLEMWFPKSEYGTSMKFGTKCYVSKAVANLESTLEPDELEWFHKHPQFCHFFHMSKDKNHKLMGMWMLLLRMAKTNKCKEAWFVVNGVPIRYSLREHALLSGLHCHEYPPNFTNFGNLKFVEKHFKTGKATYEAVEKKFVSMRHSPDRLKMAVLYFLSSVIIGNGKVGDGAPTVDEIFMRAVTDLEWCKTFPWGRLSFDDTMRKIFHMNGKLNGVVQASWCFPSFIIPLELLAFEAIPVLMRKFKEKVIGASCDCPRMCKTKFKSSSMRGFPLSEINDALGSTKDIRSIMEITIDEASLISRIMDDISEEGDNSDVIIDSWNKCLLVENKKIWFEELYNKDVDGRKEDKRAVAKGKQKEENADLKEIMEEGFKQVGEKMTKMETMVKDKFRNIETRLKLVERYSPTHVSVKRKESDTSPKASTKRNKTEESTKKHSKSASIKKPEANNKETKE